MKTLLSRFHMDNHYFYLSTLNHFCCQTETTICILPTRLLISASKLALFDSDLWFFATSSLFLIYDD